MSHTGRLPASLGRQALRVGKSGGGERERRREEVGEGEEKLGDGEEKGDDCNKHLWLQLLTEYMFSRRSASTMTAFCPCTPL